MQTPIITLMTDFGYKDAFVGTMKGVILGILPEARIIDLTHGISPMNILGAAYVLKTAYPYFPEDTVHICVVDPGVGSARNPIAVRACGQCFVGPDNGIFGYVLQNCSDFDCVKINSEKYSLPNCSATFHGRDIFSPVGALIARGKALNDIGSPLENPFIPPGLLPEILPDSIKGQVIHIDHFGNAITNITQEYVSGKFSNRNIAVLLNGQRIPGPYRTYSDVQPYTPIALFGSEGHLEISVNLGSAEKELGVAVGAMVSVVASAA